MQLIGHEWIVQEQLYCQMFRHAPGALGIIDTTGHWIDVNEAMHRMLGYSKQDLYGKRCDELPESGHPDETAFQFEQTLRRKLSHHRAEKVIIHKEGYALHVLFTMTLIKDVRDQPQWFLVQVERLAGRRDGESHRTGQLYRAFSRTTSDAFVLFDPSGLVLEINEAFTKVFGWLPEEVIGKRLPAAPKEYEHHTRSMIDTARSGETVHGFETVRQRKDGSLINVSVSIVPIYDESGELTVLAATVKDVTLQNKLWQLARESEETFSNLIEHTTEPFLVFRHHTCIYANMACLRMFGAEDMNAVIERAVTEFVHPDSASLVDERLTRAMQGLINGPTELELCRFDGEVIDVEAVFIPGVLGGESCIHMLLRDISERKRAQELIRISDKMKAVGQMAAGLAHEIRNPLTAIKGFVQLAESQFSGKLEYFTIIKSEIERIDSITSEMLMLAKPNPSKMRVADLRLVLRAVSNLLETQAILNNIEIAYEFSGEPGWVQCDENQIKQVFVNLIKNAIEAMKSGGCITVSMRHDQERRVVTEVRDEGCGIPEEQLMKIGQPFFTTKEKGTGLGLMVSYKIIENHRGTIAVFSEANIGTTFRVCLPLASEI